MQSIISADTQANTAPAASFRVKVEFFIFKP